MTQQGATLQNYNNELVKCKRLSSQQHGCFCSGHTHVPHASICAGIEDLREKREEVNRSIAKDEEEKGKLLLLLCQTTHLHASPCHHRELRLHGGRGSATTSSTKKERLLTHVHARVGCAPVTRSEDPE